MKAVAWVVALVGLLVATVTPRSIAVAVCVVAALAWGFLFAIDFMEHR